MKKFKLGDKVILANGKKWKSGSEYKIIDRVLDKGYFLNGTIMVWYDNELKLYKEEKTVGKTFQEVVNCSKDEETWTWEDFKIEKYKGVIDIRFGETPGICGITFDGSERFVLEKRAINFAAAFEKFWGGIKIESSEGRIFEYDSQTTLVTIEDRNKKNIRKRRLTDGLFSALEMTKDWYLAD